MSRIDEALRRAAERTVGTGAPDTSRPSASDQDVALLEHEAYPEETERSRDTAPLQPGASDEEMTVLGNEPYPDEAPAGEASAQLTAGTADAASHGTGLPHASAAAYENAPAAGSLFDRIDERLAEKTVVDAGMSAVAREQYRRVAAVLHDAQGTAGLRVIMVCSAVPGEGKTLTAANLALTLSESYHRRVLLIDADLRKPTIHQIFRIDSAVGLTTGLDPSQPPRLIVHQMSPRLSILPAGRPTSDPMAGLTSDRMRRLLEEAKATFDWVIIDTPPLMLLPDAHLLASMVDGAVLVIRAYSTPHDAARRVADAIGRTRIVGVVLNQANPASTGGKNNYYYSYYTREASDARDKDLARR